ncbi:MAG: helix-turn-helix transcriptional regulator [Clostridia bacterium]|nr:helix-turn-helix transcriptional regulator [Clostridia bacterium]
MKLKDAVAKRLQYLLNNPKISQYQLFKRTGIPQSTISTIKNGKADDIKLSTIYQICIGFGIEFMDFFNDDNLKIENLED